MNTLGGALCTLCLATASPVQVAADEAMSQVSRSAERELAGSIEDLHRLREQISNEKLPLAQELTSLEEKLSELRGDHETVTRLLDNSHLEISAVTREVKELEDELTYVGNLLDEYARNFESKVNVSELQYCGETIEAAKQANGNAALSWTEKFALLTALVDVTAQRLLDAVGGMRFPGVGVDLQGGVASGQFAILGPVALFRGEGGGATGYVVPQSGSTKPLIRPLDDALQGGIAALVDGGDGFLPLDPSRGGALKALVQKTSIVHLFEKGGPIMWPLLLASILALGTVIERFVFLAAERLKRDPKALDAFFAAATRGDTEEAIRIGRTSKFYVVRALGYALAHKEQSLATALLYSQAQEMKRFRRGIPILDTVITLAPLLGLLGTVTGMMGSFSLIGGELGAPGAITGGIAEALIATAFGLGIAITALLPFNFLNARMDEARHEIESAATQLELLVQQQAGTVAPVAEAHAGRETSPGQQQELQRRRAALERQMAELEQQELVMGVLPARGRTLDPARSYTGQE